MLRPVAWPPGVQEACEEKMNCVCVCLLQGLTKTGTLRRRGSREFTDTSCPVLVEDELPQGRGSA